MKLPAVDALAPENPDRPSEALAERMLADRERYAKPIILTGAQVR